jgi:D-inositol-3-phosphate glycosyltransferase
VKPNLNLSPEALIDFFDNNRNIEFTTEVKKEKEKYAWNKMTAAIKDVFYKIESPHPNSGH